MQQLPMLETPLSIASQLLADTNEHEKQLPFASQYFPAAQSPWVRQPCAACTSTTSAGSRITMMAAPLLQQWQQCDHALSACQAVRILSLARICRLCPACYAAAHAKIKLLFSA